MIPRAFVGCILGAALAGRLAALRSGGARPEGVRVVDLDGQLEV